MVRCGTFTLVAALTLAAQPTYAMVLGKPVHGLSIYGEASLPSDFTHFEYANPEAPKGGSLTRAAIGTFDSFNAFSFKGNKPSPGIIQFMGNGHFFYFNEPLTARAAGQSMTAYCLVCETVMVAPDRTWIEYTLRPEARFHDGSPITVEDVIFSMDILKTKGHPRYKLYWGDVTRGEKTGERTVRFHFKDDKNTELPMLVGELPVLSKKFWEGRDFEAATLDVPVASGPYRIDRFEGGRYFVLKRDPNYWGKDLPVTRGAFNFDEIRVDYYRDDDVAFQAFTNGSLDMRVESDSTRWATGYDQSLVDAGALIKEGFQDSQPDEIHPFVMNLRRAKFSDPRVRQALSLALDFDGTNRTVAHSLMKPFQSFWQGSELGSEGLPQGEELAILEQFRGQIPDEVFTTPFTPPRTEKDGALRDNLIVAQKLLVDAGWTVKDGVLVNAAGERFEFEFLMRLPVFEKWVGPYLRNLERIGVKGTMRVIDPTQYLNRMNEFDFDMTIGEQPLWGGQSDSPGNEQREQWTSASADRHGSENWPGIKNPAIDVLVEQLIKAPNRESLVAHAHALDRILLWNHYVIPGFAEPEIWWAYWNKLGRPAITPAQGPNPALWWFDAAKAAQLDKTMQAKRGAGDAPGGTGSRNIVIGLAAAALLVVLFVVARRRRASH
jgi:microcin C transport system substrate-binding protein